MLAERGAAVVLNGRTAAKLETVQAEIAAAGGRAIVASGDVSCRSEVARVVDLTISTFGGVDILVNNARASSPDVSVLGLADEDMDLTFRSGALGTLYAMQACHPHLKARGGGAIINFGSSTALAGDPGFAAYVMTKEAIRGLSRIAAKEWGPDGIRVNVICPAADEPVGRGVRGARPREIPTSPARHTTRSVRRSSR